MSRFRLLLLMSVLCPATALAQVPAVPGSADAGRVDLKIDDLSKNTREGSPAMERPSVAQTEAPDGAENIRFVLKDVRVEGATVFTPQQLDEIYGQYEGQEITLDKVWEFSARLTQLYRNEGYFLSRSYVPTQNIDQGIVTLNVVEGYVGRIVLEDEFAQSYVVDIANDDLLAQQPARIDTVESYLLRLNDLPGLDFRAVLSPPIDPNAPEGSVDLVLKAARDSGKGLVRLDNYGSRFLGPYQAYGYYETSFIPLHKTSLSLLSSVPVDELKNAALKHTVALTPDLTFELGGSVTSAEPGYRLKTFDLKSRSVSWETALAYQMIRQRNENLSLRLGLNGRNTKSNLAGTPFTRDRIVALRAGLSYDLMDGWNGQNILSAVLSQGIDGLGSSDSGEAFLSRAQADPDFTKLELSVARAQALPGNFVVQGRVSGQLASKPLYSSEEYGYGGQSFGRAYDASELTGDEGISASAELQYNGWLDWKPVGVSPFIFYDIGKIWNLDPGQVQKESAASAGFGLRFETAYQISGELGLAFPLTQSADAPLNGGNGKNPRILFQVSKQF